MSYIVEFEVETPLFHETFQAVPEMVIEYEALHYTPDGSARYVFWAYGEDFQQFEEALGNDSTIAEFVAITDVGDNRLYRVIYTEAGRRALTYPVATKHDIAFLDVRNRLAGTEVRARVPSRESLFAYRDGCRERDIPFRLNRIYREEQTEGEGFGFKFGVSEAQREALIATLDRGYFAIPRETTLKDISDDLGISTQALSTRLRRGQTNLIRHTLAVDI